MAAAQAFYPYFKTTHTSSFFKVLGGDQPDSVTPEIQFWKGVVDTVEKDSVVTQADTGEFEVDHNRLNVALKDASHRHAVLNAVAWANAAAKVTPGTATKTPGGKTAADVITGIIGSVPSIGDIEADVKAIAKGTKVVAKHWWGVELAFTDDASVALARLLGKNLSNIPALLTALAAIPALAVLGIVSGIVGAILKLLGEWVTAANAAHNGVLLTMYAWIFPWFAASDTPITVP
jgi:hypothetical protein